MPKGVEHLERVDKPVVGLLGGMGSGKSLVARLLAERGAKVISGDRLGHEALAQPAIREQVAQRWGPGILGADGQIDRRRLAVIVFADPAERKALEALVHPWIARRLREEVKAARAEPAVRLVVLDAAIMLEAGWDEVCDRLVFVDAPRAERLRRLAEQRGWTPEEVEARESAQLSLGEKRNCADHVLVNTGSPEELARQVEDLLGRWGLDN